MSSNMAWDILHGFSFAQLRFFYMPDEDVHLTAHEKGQVLRGAFGHKLRDIICLFPGQECGACTGLEKCLYTQIFSPVNRAGAEFLSKNMNIPRGFVLKPMPGEKEVFGPGEPFYLDLILVGRTMRFIPYLIVPFRELGRRGLGRNRGRASLRSIWTGDLETHLEFFNGRTQVVKNTELAVCFQAVNALASTLDTHNITLNFRTPTSIRYNPTGERNRSRAVRSPEFHHIIKRLRDRVNSLARFYCDEELKVDYKEYGLRAEEVRKTADSTRWVENARKSRAGYWHDLSGFVGSVHFEGELADYLPLLVLGHFLHVGENAVFGNGWYDIEGLTCDPFDCLRTDQAAVGSVAHGAS